MAEICTGKLWDHLRNPRNVGYLPNSNVMAQAGDPDSGASVLYLLEIDGETVRNMRFLARGCGVAVATSSVATELVIGMSLDEVQALDHLAIADALGGLPKEKMYCAEMTVAALHAAVIDYRTGVDATLPSVPEHSHFEKGIAAVKR